MSAAPLGTFEEHVMLATVRLGEGAYGMQVRREIETCTGREVAIGAIYATLDRLEAKGLVASRRQKLDGQSRRLFAVTKAGIVALEASKEMRDALWQGVELTPEPGLTF